MPWRDRPPSASERFGTASAIFSRSVRPLWLRWRARRMRRVRPIAFLRRKRRLDPIANYSRIRRRQWNQRPKRQAVWSGWKRVRRRTYWARELGALGHEVQPMPAQYVKAYIKPNKHDARQARSACCCGAPLRSTARASRRARCATASGISAHDAAQTTFASRVDRRRRSARSTFSSDEVSRATACAGDAHPVRVMAVMAIP